MLGPPSWLLSVPFAHRGRFDEAVPENSLAAFESATRSGCGVELDVRLGADEVVVFHDPELSRLCGIDVDLLDAPPALVASARLLGTQERIPSLSEALDLLGSTPTIVEVKPEPSSLLRKELVSRVVRIVSRHAAAGHPVALHSFDPRVVRLLSKHAPHLPRGQAAGDDEGTPLHRFTRDTYVSAPVLRPSFIAHNVERLPTARVSSLRSWGIPTFAWTARTAADLELVAFEVDNVIAEGEALETVLAAGSFETYRSGLAHPRLGWRWPWTARSRRP